MARRETGIADYVNLEELPETFLKKDEIVLLMFNMCKNYKGNIDKLRDAIGILMISQLYGYRVVKLIYSRNALKDVEDIIGKKITDISYEETHYTDRSIALNFLKKSKAMLENFEKAFNDMIYGRLEKPKEYKIVN